MQLPDTSSGTYPFEPLTVLVVPLGRRRGPSVPACLSDRAPVCMGMPKIVTKLNSHLPCCILVLCQGSAGVVQPHTSNYFSGTASSVNMRTVAPTAEGASRQEALRFDSIRLPAVLRYLYLQAVGIHGYNSKPFTIRLTTGLDPEMFLMCPRARHSSNFRDATRNFSRQAQQSV
jgi:hypothetical protein